METGVVNAAPPSFDNRRISGPAQLPTLIDAADAANRVGLTSERLLELVGSSHVPHHFYDGRGPFFKIYELAKWVKENLFQSVHGLPMPKKIEVIVDTAFSQSRVPTSITQIDGLKEMPLCNYPSGVYFLAHKGEVVYIGQSVSVGIRVSHHVASKTKLFDSVFYVAVPVSELDRVEGSLIAILRPKYNGHGPSVTPADQENIARQYLGRSAPAAVGEGVGA